MTLIIVQHQVKDYEAWRPFYDQDLPRRQDAGVKSETVYQSAQDPNNVHLLFEVEDSADIEDMLKDEDLKRLMEEAGVISEPVATVLYEAYAVSETEAE